MIKRPGRPQGHHVHLLRTHLGLTQTRLGALLGVHQPDVSTWEGQRKEEFLPPELARRFLEVWDCFPEKPEGGFDEMMASLAAYRGENAAVPSLPIHGQPVRLVPEIPVSGEPPEIYWVPKAVPSESRTLKPSSIAGPKTEQDLEAKQEREVIQLQLSLFTVWILFAVWSRAPNRQNGALWTRAFRIGATMASLAILLFPTACFQAHQEGLRRETEQCSEQTQVYTPLPNRIYTENVKQESGESEAAARRSIPMPEKPFSFQKLAPCEDGENEKRGGCWAVLKNVHPPCPNYSVEDDGECLIAIPAKPKSPRSNTPKKP